MRNLADAGCDDETIGVFLQLEGKVNRQLRILAEHRKNLLQAYHEDQRKIDCLDFLIFNLKQKKHEKTDE